jgi:leukotriene-A4 hydrolase
MKDFNDPHSHARPSEAAIRHLDLDLEVDFSKRILRGTARLNLTLAPGATELRLDTKKLRIDAVRDERGRALPFRLGPEHPFLGQALIIGLTPGLERVAIDYETSPEAAALQWLDPVQTEGKRNPFLFTQSQAILARSWIPIQDSPGIRFTYQARVKVPGNLLPLMSARNPQAYTADGVYDFTMDLPIPAYLMALAVGEVRFAPVGPRTGVYAEPEMLERARYEFAEMEDMLVIAEKLYGNYRWERYDLIILPPSFPFGGMENPRLTFATPTVVAGDRSLTSLVAHELAHSWSGNLVTNATWNDFWLNEGFTVYFENRIMEVLYGKSYAEMLAALSQDELIREVTDFMNSGRAQDTRLKLDLAQRDPDEGVNTIAYDKGFSFLKYLEHLVGRNKFDHFLKSYFNQHAFQANDTENFLQYLDSQLFEKEEIVPPPDLREWIYEPGLPSTLVPIRSARFAAVDAARETWLAGGSAGDIPASEWTAHEWVRFLRLLPLDISVDRLAELDAAHLLSRSGNSEILAAWLLHTVRHGYREAFGVMENFLVHTGRRKFLMPLYGELSKTEEGRKRALDIYRKARPNYHYVSVNSLDALLAWKG